MSEANKDLFNLTMSEQVQPLFEAVKAHIRDNVDPHSQEYFSLDKEKTDRWSFHPRQLEILDAMKQKARDAGLWNFFLPGDEGGAGLSNLDYAYIAAELGKSPLASESMNCSAPDTGNMEVLERVGTEAQKKQWLEPLLNGEIRSAYAMTEPNVASSDAKNISTSAVLDGDEWVINGEKYYISGAGDPRCKILITMVKTNPDAEPFRQQSQILVPMDSPGLEILGAMRQLRRRRGFRRRPVDLPGGGLLDRLEKTPYHSVLEPAPRALLVRLLVPVAHRLAGPEVVVPPPACQTPSRSAGDPARTPSVVAAACATAASPPDRTRSRTC